MSLRVPYRPAADPQWTKAHSVIARSEQRDEATQGEPHEPTTFLLVLLSRKPAASHRAIVAGIMA